MQVLDVLVEKIQGGDNDDIAVLLLGYEDSSPAWPMVLCDLGIPWSEGSIKGFVCLP